MDYSKTGRRLRGKVARFAGELQIKTTIRKNTLRPYTYSSDIMDKIWLIQNADRSSIEGLAKQLKVAPVVAGLLWRRGLYSLAAARSFFNPTTHSMHDPLLMKGMDIAVAAILERIKTHKPILIFGDYDVDGTTAASTLTLFLQEVGAKVTYYIPDRDLEGYGVSLKGIDYAEKIGSDLIITCDCGITAVKQTAYAREKDINLIVTDHHIPGQIGRASCRERV